MKKQIKNKFLISSLIIATSMLIGCQYKNGQNGISIPFQYGYNDYDVGIWTASVPGFQSDDATNPTSITLTIAGSNAEAAYGAGCDSYYYFDGGYKTITNTGTYTIHGKEDNTSYYDAYFVDLYCPGPDYSADMTMSFTANGVAYHGAAVLTGFVPTRANK